MSTFRPSNAAAKAYPNAISVRIKSRDAKGTANQRAHDLRIGRQPKYVDGDRSYLNRHLMRALTAAEIRKICDQRREESGRVRERKVAKNAAVSTVGIITFGVDAQKVVSLLGIDRQDELFAEVAEAVANRLGTTVTGLSVHLDESAIHAHFQMPAVSKYGTPVSKIAVKKVLNEIQSIAAEIASQYDSRIERGTPRLKREKAGATRSQTINRQVRQLHEDLPAEIAELQGKADREQARYEKNKRLADKAAAKADEDDARAEKARNNQAKYERRAADAQAKLDGMQKELARLQSIQDEIAAAETRLAPLRAAMDALDTHNEEQANAAEAEASQAAEAEAASMMFGSDATIATLAVLAAGDEVIYDGYGRELGGWQFEEIFEDHSVELAASKLTDFRSVASKLADASFDTVPAIVDDFCGTEEAKHEFETLKWAIEEVGFAFKAAGQWSRKLLDKARGATRQLIEMSFERLAAALRGEQKPPQIEAPKPETAKPFTDLPKPVQDAIRKTSEPDDPTSGP